MKIRENLILAATTGLMLSSCSSSSEADVIPINLNVDCQAGDHYQTAGGLNTDQEHKIVARTTEGSVILFGKLGKYGLAGVEPTRHNAGTILADLGSAILVAGDLRPINASSDVSLICK